MTLTPTMQKCADWMANNGRSIYRHPGGFWGPEDPIASYRTRSFGTSSVEALVKRGVAEYTDWKDGKSGRFPIRATLKTMPVVLEFQGERHVMS